MNEALYDYVASFGFKKFDDRTRELIQGMGRKELIAFAQGAEAITEYAQSPAKTSFEFSASETFAGQPTPCGNLPCRLQRVREVAYFAALYADRVLVSSPFPGMESVEGTADLRSEVFAALGFYFHLQPLVTAGLIEYTHHDHGNVCLDCFAQLAGKSVDQWSTMRAALEREYKERVKYYLMRDEFGIHVEPDGPSDLFDQHNIITLRKIPKSVRAHLRGKGPWLLPPAIVDELELAQDYATRVAVDLLGRDVCAGRFGTGYLTRREIDLRIVSDVTHRVSDTFIDRNLGHEIPMLEGVTPANLLKLRADEADAFKSYQVALRKASIESADNGAANLSDLFRDVVAPEIRRMDAALTTARSTLLRGLGADAASATAFVSLAFFSGLVTPGLATAITALGGIHFTDKVAEKLSKLIKQEPEEARQNPFYFVWRASKAARKQKRRTV